MKIGPSNRRDNRSAQKACVLELCDVNVIGALYQTVLVSILLSLKDSLGVVKLPKLGPRVSLLKANIIQKRWHSPLRNTYRPGVQVQTFGVKVKRIKPMANSV
jgi:hypothetical protein